MAIRIPSRNIYGNPSNQVVRKNIIDIVEVNEKKVNIIKDFHAIVLSEEVFANVSNPPINSEEDEQKNFAYAPFNTYYYFEMLAWVRLSATFLSFSLEIPINANNKLITNIYNGVDSNNEPLIKYDINYDYITYGLTGKWHKVDADKIPSYDDYIDNITQNSPQTENRGGIISNEDILQYTYVLEGTPAEGQNVVVGTSIENQATIKNVTIQKTNNSFLLSGKLLIGLQKENLSRNRTAVQIGSPDDTNIIDLAGDGIEYSPKSVTVTVYGDTFTLTLDDVTTKIGDGNNVFSIDGNELMQTDDIPTVQKRYASLLQSYKNGKETAVILCSISDYKDDDGNKVIDITTSDSDKMMFDIGDEVIPMVYTANGVDVPMSIDKADNAKVFRVVGTKPYYDGAVWQELTLQEK